jgi:hypothetical protein
MLRFRIDGSKAKARDTHNGRAIWPFVFGRIHGSEDFGNAAGSGQLMPIHPRPRDVFMEASMVFGGELWPDSGPSRRCAR